MFEDPNISTIAIGGITVTVLMVTALSYIAFEGLGEDVHSPNSKADRKAENLPSADSEEESMADPDSTDSTA
ncbi:MAG: hypothetical protein A07HR60_00462 [uncultured archaeon A07HR60]|nr:MAG: hypothetical protein A07HR60_00462 [uncultured archaeon A07HR60]